MDLDTGVDDEKHYFAESAHPDLDRPRAWLNQFYDWKHDRYDPSKGDLVTDIAKHGWQYPRRDQWWFSDEYERWALVQKRLYEVLDDHIGLQIQLLQRNPGAPGVESRLESNSDRIRELRKELLRIETQVAIAVRKKVIEMSRQ